MANNFLISDSSSRKSLQELVQAFKLESIVGSITPLRDGTIMEKLLSLTKDETDLLEHYIKLQAQETAGANFFGSIEFDDLDVSDNLDDYKFGLRPACLVVFKDGVVRGITYLFAMGDHLYQTFTSCFKIEDVEKSTIDPLLYPLNVYTYYRFYSRYPQTVTCSRWELTTPQLVNQLDDGLMSHLDKQKLDDIDENANNYKLPVASDSAIGGVKSQKTGTTSGRDYNVEVDKDGKMKVNVPWVNTEYPLASLKNPGLLSPDHYNLLSDMNFCSLISTNYWLYEMNRQTGWKETMDWFLSDDQLKNVGQSYCFLVRSGLFDNRMVGFGNFIVDPVHELVTQNLVTNLLLEDGYISESESSAQPHHYYRIYNPDTETFSLWQEESEPVRYLDLQRLNDNDNLKNLDPNFRYIVRWYNSEYGLYKNVGELFFAREMNMQFVISNVLVEFGKFKFANSGGVVLPGTYTGPVLDEDNVHFYCRVHFKDTESVLNPFHGWKELPNVSDKERIDALWEFYQSFPEANNEVVAVVNRKAEAIAPSGHDILYQAQATASSLALDSIREGKLVLNGADDQMILEIRRLLGEDLFNELAVANVQTMELHPQLTIEQQIEAAKAQYYAAKEADKIAQEDQSENQVEPKNKASK